VDEVSTHAIALLLACVRNLVEIHGRVAGGDWETTRSYPLYRLTGRTLGIIGLGKIGRAVVHKLQSWGLNMMATDPYIEPETAAAIGVRLVSLEQLCQDADYISLHCPLLPETRHLLGTRQFALMKPGVMIINTARGPVLDTAALIAALNCGQVARAGLDVFEEEPLPVDSPLRRHPSVLLSDHVAWYSEESQVELQSWAAEEVVRVCTGQLPVSLTNPEVLHRLGRFQEWTPPEQMRWQLRRLARLTP
jgi:D-3-phosphoglycerate dehydrogenase